MAEGSPPDLLETTLLGRSFRGSLGLAEQLSPVLEIKPMALVPINTRHRSGKAERRQNLKRHREPDRYLNGQSKASANSTCTAQDDSRSRKSPDMQSCKLVKRLSQATFPDEFPELASVKRKLSLCLSPPQCNTPQKNSAAEPCAAEWLTITMQYAQLMPPPEYSHQCMPVSYRLKGSPVTIDQLNVLKIFEDLRFALSSRPVLQVSHSSEIKRESTNCCTGMQRLSSLKSRPPTRIVPKTPRRLTPIANLSVKGIPKELNVVSTYDRLPIVYSKRYNLKYSKAMKIYKFDEIMLPDKPARVYSILEAKLYKVMLNECVEWEAVDIANVFDITKYIPDAVKKFDIVNVARIMKVDFHGAIPNWSDFDSAMLCPLRLQMMGSVVTCKLATDLGWAINIGGGFCHNTAQFGKGLAAYDDVLVCLTIVSKFPKMNHILVIDCDAYQCSNYKYVEDISCPVTVLDFYFKPYYESTTNQSSRSCNNHVDYYGYKFEDKNASHHLYKLWKLLSGYLKDLSRPRPSLCIYIAGTNVLDPSNPVQFTTKNIITRDQIVFQTLYIFHNIPVAILLGGGYKHYDVEAAAVSICQLCKTVSSKKYQNGSTGHSYIAK